MSILHRLEEKQSAAPDNSRNPHRSDSIESSLVREKGLTDVPWKLARSHISSLYMPNHIAPVLPAAGYLQKHRNHIRLVCNYKEHMLTKQEREIGLITDNHGIDQERRVLSWTAINGGNGEGPVDSYREQWS
jgi:hypothetical protein